MKYRLPPFAVCACFLFAYSSLASSTLSELVQGVATSTESFLGSLSESQKARALMPFEDSERMNWHYVPKSRKGISLKELDDIQDGLLHRLIDSVLSEVGSEKVEGIIDLERVLFALENRSFRDPEEYYLSVFGTPRSGDAWGLRFEGHHLSLNFTFGMEGAISVTPQFWGANPAEVRTQGDPRLYERVLRSEEEFARELLDTFSSDQKAKAIISESAYRDIITAAQKKVNPLDGRGIRMSELEPAQRDGVIKLIRVYLNNMEETIATDRWEKMVSLGLEEISFAWAGSTLRGKGHYYRIQGPSFVIEYDNVQNAANHIHTVWRDFEGDFGRDLLQEHYRSEAHDH